MIQEATMMRFHPQTEYVKKMIKDKKIGNVHYISAIFSITNLNYNDIRYKYSKGGGALYDLEVIVRVLLEEFWEWSPLKYLPTKV